VIEETVYVTFQVPIAIQPLKLPAELDVESLDPDNMPGRIEGKLRYPDGSWEDHDLHGNEEKHLWLLGNLFGYRLRMVGNGPRFVAESLSRQPPVESAGRL
jgi:hypothetical protein